MKTFLSQIAEDIQPDDLDSLKDKVYVFPTRRACYYFRETLLKRFEGETFWSPQILSIEDFIAQCCGETASSEIDLLFALYHVYASTYQPHPEGSIDKEDLPTFDRFFSWGQVLLRDFDEVDKYLVDADKLYRNLQDLKDLETLYADNEEIMFALKRFNDMMGGDQTNLMVNYTHQWTRVCKTYHVYKEYLATHQLRYTGQLYRHIAGQLQSGTLKLPFEQVIFAGFNALSRAEEVIFDQLLTSGQARLYWDADKLYLEDEMEEAGKFMRKYKKRWPASDTVHWLVTDMRNNQAEISMMGGVQSTGQAQMVGQLLDALPTEQQERSAVVLGDENLLFPVLYALPENSKHLNVTMGYPLKKSLWFRLASAYLQFQLQIRGRAPKAFFEITSLKAFLANPLLQRAAETAVPALQRQLRKKRSKWVAQSELVDQELPATIKLALNPAERLAEILKNLRELMVIIYQKMRMDKSQGVLEAEFAYHSIKHLKQLEERLSRHTHQIEPRTLSRLVSEAFEQAKVPFTGEPVTGLQLMGFLETRALDFEHLYLLSVNEGKLPKGMQHRSYIPYALRKAFKMPTFEEQDAIYAYHFKRLFQRAKNITILYNTEVAIDGSGEKSRFLWQLQQVFPKNQLKEQIFQMPMNGRPAGPGLSIEKSAEVTRLMARFLVGSEPLKALSATAIRHYLDCSLRFYFRYVIELPEREQVSDELDARDFGNIVHQALEYIYQPLAGQTITKVKLQELIASEVVNEAVNRSFQKYYHGTVAPTLEGKDVLHQHIVQRLLLKVLQNDLRTTPFKVMSAEQRISEVMTLLNGRQIKLEGTLDRVHIINEVDHIVDYKTGRADLVRTYSPQFPDKGAPYVQTHFDEPRFKSGFQGLYYGYLWSLIHGERKVKIGVFPLKKVNEGIQWLNHGAVIPPLGFQVFQERLLHTLDELFDEKVPFVQTNDVERCRYCPYQEICQR